VVTRAYELDFPLKYGCNPHQLPANIYRMAGGKLPFKVSSSSSSSSSSSASADFQRAPITHVRMPINTSKISSFSSS
jgi:AICAR transformylase/IMP cyclohydrolase PurH